MLFFLFYHLFNVTSSQQVCKAPCNECPSSYYYNKGIQIKDIIDFETDCLLKPSAEMFYSKDFYLSNKSCDDVESPSTCIGDVDNPMDDFWSVIKKIYNEDEAHKFQTQNIRIFLIGNPHFIIYDESLFSSLDSTNLKVFKDFNNGTIQILPLFCDDQNMIKNCLNDPIDLVDVYIKIDLFQFFINNKFSIENVRFWGNDIANINYKNDLCLRQKTICCLASNSFCNTNKKFVINNNNLDKKSMFILDSKSELEIIELLFINVQFFNFYAVKEEIGWKSLIYSENSLKKIQFVNLTILNFFFSHGLLYDLYSPTTIYQEINNIMMKNVYIGDSNSIIYVLSSSNSFFFKTGLFCFKNSSFLSLNVTNLTISYLNMYYSNQMQHAFLFEFVLNPQLKFNGLNFKNNIDMGFCYADSSLKLYINDFNLRNITYLKETSFLLLLYGSSTILENGLFFLITNFKSSFFNCQKSSELSLKNIEISFCFGVFGNYSNSAISISDGKIENFKGSIFMQLLRCNFTVNNLNFSLCIFSQKAFYILDARNFIYNQSWCNNIEAPVFFSMQSKYYDERAKVLFSFIRIMNIASNLTFLFSDGVPIDFLIFKNMEIFNCSSLFLLNVKASFISISLINISINNMIYSLLYFVTIEQKDLFNFLAPGFAFVKITNIFVLNSRFLYSFFFFQMPEKLIKIDVEQFIADYFECPRIFDFKSLSIPYKNYQAKFNNISLTNMKTVRIPLGFHFFVYSYSSIDFVLITNLIANNCDTIQILALPKNFNSITLDNISLAFITKNNYFSIYIIQSNQKYYSYVSKIIIQNLKINMFISKDIYAFFLIQTVNTPILLILRNCYFENLQIWSIFCISSLISNLFSIETSSLEFNNLKSVNNYFYFFYSQQAMLSNFSSSNLFIHDSETFILIYLIQMFQNIALENITMTNIQYNRFYVITINQKLSYFVGSSKVKMQNIFFLDVEVNNDLDPSISSLVFNNFDELILENAVVKNMRSYKLKAKGLVIFSIFTNFTILRINNFIFDQNVYSNLDQVLQLSFITYVNVNNCRINVSLESPSIRRFQGFVIGECINVTFRNNEFYGLSTIEKPEIKSEEMGVVHFRVEKLYDSTLERNFTLMIESKNLTSYLAGGKKIKSELFGS